MQERLKQIIDYYSLSVRGFSIEIGVDESSIRKILAERGGMNSTTLQKIHGKYPEVNWDWLIIGRGSMFYDNSKNRTTIVIILIFRKLRGCMKNCLMNVNNVLLN